MYQVIDKPDGEPFIAAFLMKDRYAELIDFPNRQLQPKRQNGGSWAKTEDNELYP